MRKQKTEGKVNEVFIHLTDHNSTVSDVFIPYMPRFPMEIPREKLVLDFLTLATFHFVSSVKCRQHFRKAINSLQKTRFNFDKNELPDFKCAKANISHRK
jgi:hypothetical protein